MFRCPPIYRWARLRSQCGSAPVRRRWTTFRSPRSVPVCSRLLMSDGKKNERFFSVFSDGSFISLENRAHPGDRLRAFVTGLGRPVSKKRSPSGDEPGGHYR